MKQELKGFIVLLLMLSQLAFSQERTVSGTVSDNTGMPIPGVTVSVKGTKNTTQTDFDGKYSIKASPNQTLLFTYIGMKANEEPASSATVNAKMVGDALELEGVVVVAFGTQKKSEITGAVTKIDAKALENTQASNAIQSLTGKVAGVQISANSGQPGDPPQVRFRGIGSISSSNAPLYVVDGF
ncbi:carboxypeptidase-like regulatory domain-containing protein, partial [Flavobacterium sp. LBUM151]